MSSHDNYQIFTRQWVSYSNSICVVSCIALRRAKSGADSMPPPPPPLFFNNNWLRWCSRRLGLCWFMVSDWWWPLSEFVSVSKVRPQLQQHFEQQHCIGGRTVFGFNLCFGLDDGWANDGLWFTLWCVLSYRKVFEIIIVFVTPTLMDRTDNFTRDVPARRCGGDPLL